MILDKIENYLSNGGLFNPELMEHEKVKNLIMDCKEEIQKRDAEIDNLVLTNKIIGNDKECFKLEIKRQKEEIQKLDELIRDAIAIINFLNPFKAGKSVQWVEKAKKLVGEK